MGFISELRSPTKWYAKVAIAVLSLLLFAGLVATAVAGYLVYRMEFPSRGRSETNLQNFPGHPQQLSFTVNGGGQREGWFFPGLKSAPSVVLCPPYESGRAELLTLATALQEQQYNVFVFDFSAHGSAGGRSTLGFQEVGELRAAMSAVANRGDVDVNRFGLWGANMGAYVALMEAVNDKRVRAVAAESPYDYPSDMAAVLVSRSGLGAIPMVTRLARTILYSLNPQSHKVPPLRTKLANLAGVPQLYLQSTEEPLLAASTQKLFQLSPIPHELVVLQHGNYAGMLDDEKREYENRIVSFFLMNLPLTAGN